MDFITIDFETALYRRYSAISVGLVRFINDTPVESTYSLICPPELYVRPDFTAIHGLTLEDVINAPKFPEVWKTVIKPFISDTSKSNGKQLPLVAHNASFDSSVLSSCLSFYEMTPLSKEIQWICSLRAAKKTWPDFPLHKLTYLAQHFGITYDAHNALADAETCGKILVLAHKENVTNQE